MLGWLKWGKGTHTPTETRNAMGAGFTAQIIAARESWIIPG